MPARLNNLRFRSLRTQIETQQRALGKLFNRCPLPQSYLFNRNYKHAHALCGPGLVISLIRGHKRIHHLIQFSLGEPSAAGHNAQALLRVADTFQRVFFEQH